MSLRGLSDDKWAHALKGLSTLAKFLGIHDVFSALRRNYGLKWAGKSSAGLIIARLTKAVDAWNLVIDLGGGIG